MPRDDELIKKDVVDQLYWDDRVDASEVAVNVKDGTVTLEGTVDAYWKKFHAEEVISRLNGVLYIENGIVELIGTVPSWAAGRAAYEAALYTSGVIDVQDNLVIEAA